MDQNAAAEAFLRAQAALAWDERWRISWDMNGDGATTISDTLLYFKWLFFAPGDWLLLMFMQHAPNVGVYLEMTPAGWLYGFWSGVFSALGWFCVVAWVVGIVSAPIEKYQKWKNR